MIPQGACAGCGAAELVAVDDFAVVEADRELEVLLLSCSDCGDRREVVRQVA